MVLPLQKPRSDVGGPVGIDFDQMKFVGFRDSAGRVGVLSARCAHMGADLARGRVANGRLCCPLHGWEYSSDGSCQRIPASIRFPHLRDSVLILPLSSTDMCIFATARCRHIRCRFLTGSVAMIYSRPHRSSFGSRYLGISIGANAFDVQHFRTAHDRTLVGDLVVDSPAPLARRIIGTYRVTGDHWRDRLTKAFSGPDVTMSATVWGGPLVLVIATVSQNNVLWPGEYSAGNGCARAS